MTIVEELRTDRESGARRLEAEYKAGLMTLARRFCADEGDAEELVNRTLAAVVDGIDDYLEQSAFFGWMCKILENIRAKDLRRKSNRTVAEDSAQIDAARDDDAGERILREVDASLLRDAIGDLPADMKEALLLRYFMDLPVARVARILAVPEGTVKWRLHCARMVLAAKLGAATRKPGGKMVLLALVLVAGLAIARGVAGWVSARAEAAADESHAESAADEPHAESAEFAESDSHAEFAEPGRGSGEAEPSPVDPGTSNLSPLTSYSSPPTAPAMKSSALLAASASVALAAAPAAASTTGWTYTPPPSGKTQGTLSWTDSSGFENVVNGIKIVSGTDKKLLIYERTNTGNANARNLDFSVGIEDGYELVEFQGSVFSGNSSVTNFVAPSSLVTLGRYAFNGCSALVHVGFNDGLETIGEYAFNNCTGLSTIDNFLPSSVRVVNQYAFYKCTAITTDCVAAGVEHIANRAFEFSSVPSFDCSAAPLDAIDELAFYEMPALTNVVLNESIRAIGREAFRGCTALKTVSPLLPTGLQVFGSGDNGVFYGCTALEGDVLWPNSLTNISNRSFYKSKITTFTARGKNIVRFGAHPLYGCTALTNIVLSGSIATYASALMSDCKGGSLERHVWFLGPPPAAFPDSFLTSTDRLFVTLHLPWSQQEAWREYAATAANATFTFNKATKTLPEKIDDVGTWLSGVTQNVTWWKDIDAPTLVIVR